MKVVINNCFGGFGLSNEGFELYLNKKGIKFFKEGEGEFLTHYYSVEPEKYREMQEKWFAEDRNYKRINETGWYLSDRDIKRDDPILIEVIKELKKKANGICANLKIVKIPDNIEYEISEYDGLETVEEKHRSWS